MIAVRLDANAQIGMGHLYRCLPLAKHWQASGQTVRFYCRQNDFLAARVLGEGFELDVIPSMGLMEEAVWLLNQLPSKGIFLIDGYCYSNAYIAAFKAPGRLVCAFDDDALYTYTCDVVINPHPYACNLAIRGGTPLPKLLLGGQYWCFRDEFEASVPITIRQEAFRLLVLMGGADVNGYISTVLDAVNGLQLHTTVVLGDMTRDDDQLRTRCRGNPAVAFVKSPPSMAALMKQCDLAVSAGGNTVYELCVLGVPTIVVPQTDNERTKAHYLAQDGVIYTPGDYTQASANRLRCCISHFMGSYHDRYALATVAASLVKTGGKCRIAKELLSLYQLKAGDEVKCAQSWQTNYKSERR